MMMKICLTDARLTLQCEAGLAAEGYKLVRLPPIPGIDSAVASHTDILLFRHGNTVITSKRYAEEQCEIFDFLRSAVPQLKLIYSDEEPQGEYPHDAIYNALVVGEYLFARTETVCRRITDYAKSIGLEVINVRQGYPACTVLPVSDRAAITADDGMADAMQKCGIDVLRIGNSSAILLPPYPYGFIGGAAGVSKSAVCFAGDIESHPDCAKIRDFVQKHGKRCVSLAVGSPLYDVGGMVLFEPEP